MNLCWYQEIIWLIATHQQHGQKKQERTECVAARIQDHQRPTQSGPPGWSQFSHDLRTVVAKGEPVEAYCRQYSWWWRNTEPVWWCEHCWVPFQRWWPSTRPATSRQWHWREWDKYRTKESRPDWVAPPETAWRPRTATPIAETPWVPTCASGIPNVSLRSRTLRLQTPLRSRPLPAVSTTCSGRFATQFGQQPQNRAACWRPTRSLLRCELSPPSRDLGAMVDRRLEEWVSQWLLGCFVFDSVLLRCISEERIIMRFCF